MTRDEMDILRKIANQLERIADSLTGEHIEEISLAELEESELFYNNKSVGELFSDIPVCYDTVEIIDKYELESEEEHG